MVGEEGYTHIYVNKRPKESKAVFEKDVSKSSGLHPGALLYASLQSPRFN